MSTGADRYFAGRMEDPDYRDAYEAASAPQTITYPFPLRPSFLARLDLPADMTRAEADRLCAAILALPDV